MAQVLDLAHLTSFEDRETAYWDCEGGKVLKSGNNKINWLEESSVAKSTCCSGEGLGPIPSTAPPAPEDL